jgi:Zn ribbon nucleic-acid-binding protein
MPAEACKHARTILIAKDEHEEYRECLDCGQIFDPSEQDEAQESPANFGESLSDA